MKNNKISFTGRLIGAIGVFYRINTEIKGDTLTDIKHELLKKYDLYFLPRIKINGNSISDNDYYKIPFKKN